MNRQFHSKVSFSNYVLLAALLSVAIYFVWNTEALTRPVSGILIAAILLIMVILIERMIHTTYTIRTDRTLVIHRGRFAKEVVIPLDEIAHIDRINHLRIGGRALRTSLVLVLRNNTEHYITPINEEDFIQCIIQKRKKTEEEED
ncbi:MAG: PH domain-containing protein [Bacteroidaceae bacterium]|nr:PH domain-containing protein [Bacteroidaceae bacterium]